jgi:hypothetical protein
VAPTLQSVQAAVDAFGDLLAAMAQGGSQIFFQKIADPKNATDAYPIATLTYVAFDVAQLTCQMLQNVLSWIYWAWTDPHAKGIADSRSLAVLTERPRLSLIAALRRIVCLEKRPHLDTSTGLKPLDQVIYSADPTILGAGTAFA